MAKYEWSIREVSVKSKGGTTKPMAEMTRGQRLALQDAAMKGAGYRRVTKERA